jgi:CheY-like chemotaxis protein
MEKESMQVEVCSDIASATRKLGESKFEAVVLDFLKERAEALDLLKKSREMTSHKAGVMLVVLNSSEEMPIAFRAGANFVLARPLSAVALTRTLRASYPLMVREKRRYFRCPLQTPTYISVASRAELTATSANISEGGMAITNAPALRIGERVVVRLTLPGTHTSIKLNAQVCWRDNAGRAGMEFVLASLPMKEQLASWLADRLPESQPEAILQTGDRRRHSRLSAR